MNIIYGAGKYGKIFLKFLEEQDVKVDYFCQSEADENMVIDGVEVVSLDRLCAFAVLKEKIRIYISIGNEQVSNQIKKKLYYLFLDKADIYECGNFIRNNLDFPEDTSICMLCGKRVSFLPMGNNYSLFKKHRVIGAGPRENAICPNCGCNDRSRWIYYCLSNYSDIFSSKCRVLHFGPHSGDEAIKGEICKNKKCDYYGADLDENMPYHKVDMTNIPFVDNYFDYIIANHVLEHIPDEQKALRELKRVIKPGGKIFLSFPICVDYDITDECIDENMTREQRIDRFGQEDHVRLYGMDYKERIEVAGFFAETYSPSEEMVSGMKLIEGDVCLVLMK